jgi:hypothetical protein
MIRVCRPDGRIVILDTVAPDSTVRERFDMLHRLLDPSHVRSYLEPELAEMLGGAGALSYASTLPLRLPVDVAITEQSDKGQVFRLLDDELSGGPSSGLDPVREDDTVTVVFTTCILHANRAGSDWA